MKNVLGSIFLLGLLVSACAPAGISEDAMATSLSMAIQLTLLAQETQASATATQSATDAPLVNTPANTALPTSSPTPEPTDEPTDEPSPTPYEVPDWPLFRNGDTGPEVTAIQHLLRSHNYNVNVDGIFGPQTRQQVIAFQNAKNLSADGIVGPNTWVKLIQGKMIDQGDTGQAVRALQVLLREKFGYNAVAVDGDFGPITRDAVEDFQDEYDLITDGIVGPQTWQALVAIEP